MNPQQMVMQMVAKMGNSNPMINYLIQMGQSGNSKGVENFARNVCKEKGIDFDKEFSNFMQQIKG